MRSGGKTDIDKEFMLGVQYFRLVPPREEWDAGFPA